MKLKVMWFKSGGKWYSTWEEELPFTDSEISQMYNNDEILKWVMENQTALSKVDPDFYWVIDLVDQPDDSMAFCTRLYTGYDVQSRLNNLKEKV